MNTNYNQMASLTVVNYFNENMKAIQDETNLSSMKGQLKLAVKQIGHQKDYYSVKYKKQIPSNIEPLKFWEIMKDKARQPQKYLSVVNKCIVTNEKELENIQRFVRISNDEIPETVWIHEGSKAMLFFLEHKGRYLIASNELKQGKTGDYYYIGRYITVNSQVESPDGFKSFMNTVFEKMLKPLW
jgi:acetylaranotin biosynthesis cluster protein L